ncbi:MAG: hypothetical protein KKH98_15035 [Spirochaetes bacterium]|nr:hypothetical protein [Spirochaetota bacterium]
MNIKDIRIAHKNKKNKIGDKYLLYFEKKRKGEATNAMFPIETRRSRRASTG